MIRKLFLLSMFCLILSCNSTQTGSDEKADSLFTDSSKTNVTSGVFLIEVSDSSTKGTISLPASKVQEWATEELWKEDYRLKSFREIDSLKSAGAYLEYVEKLDIGMTKDSRAWIYDTLMLPQATGYIWGVSFDSYEACPYFSGKCIYFTTVSKEGTLKSAIKLTEISSGGDPPAFGADWGTCTIGKDFIHCSDTSSYGEYGDDGYEEVTTVPQYRSYELTSDGMIQLKENKKGSEVTARRKQKQN